MVNSALDVRQRREQKRRSIERLDIDIQIGMVFQPNVCHLRPSRDDIISLYRNIF
jgi:hypothetical protein